MDFKDGKSLKYTRNVDTKKVWTRLKDK